jgi:hypothetical protein
MHKFGSRISLVYLMIASMTSAAVAQCDAESAVPVTGAPYSAVRRVITTERKADGTTTRSEATEQEARDTKGRSFRAGERHWTTNIDGKSVEKSEMLVRISDPVANTETTWDTTLKVAKIVHFPSSNGVASANHHNMNAFSFDATAKRFNGTTLGTRTIEGISVEGIGYLADKYTHECWFSADLKTKVLQTDEFPGRSFTSQLENIRLGEPDISRYQPPSGYSASHIYLQKSGKTSVR